ncbi:MAG TPA: AraC family transcriptional regulator, partial [Abditibacteriaceae bacterium]
MLWIEQSVYGWNEAWNQIDFRLHAAFSVVAAPNWRYELASQHAAELWLIRSGECVVRLGENCETARSGDVVLLKPNQYRLTTNETDSPLSIIGFVYQATLLHTLDFMTAMATPLILRKGVDISKLQDLLNQVVEASCERAPGQLFAATGAAQIALHTTLQPLVGKETDFIMRAQSALQSSLGGDVAAAMQVVFTRYSEPLELRDLAKAAHLSSPQLTRKFKAALNVSPMEYLRRHRLEQA